MNIRTFLRFRTSLFGPETFNEGFRLKRVASSFITTGIFRGCFRPLEPLLELRPEVVKALIEAQHRHGCIEEQIDASTRVTAQRVSYDQSRALLASDAWRLFDFVSNPEPGGSVATLYDAFGIDPAQPNAQLAGPAGRLRSPLRL